MPQADDNAPSARRPRRIHLGMTPEIAVWPPSVFTLPVHVLRVDIDQPELDPNDSSGTDPDGDLVAEGNRTQSTRFEKDDNYWDGEGRDSAIGGDYTEPGLYTRQTRTAEVIVPITRKVGDNYVFLASAEPANNHSHFMNPNATLDPQYNPLPPNRPLADDNSAEYIVIDPIDLDVDSDNTQTEPDYGPDCTDYEDSIEEDLHGRLVLPNTDDDDGDGIPDYLDGFDFDGVPDNSDDRNEAENDFVLAKVAFSNKINLHEDSRLSFIYNPNHVHLWRKAGHAARDNRDLKIGGDGIYPKTFRPYYTMGDFGLGGANTSTRHFFFWIEGITQHTSASGELIEVQYDVDADGQVDYTDKVRILVVDYRLNLEHDLLVINNLTNPADGIFCPPMTPDETVLHISSSPYLQAVSNLTPSGNPQYYEYSFWVSGLHDRVKVFEEVGGTRVEIINPTDLSPRWDNYTPGSNDLPDLPDQLIIETNGLHSDTYHDVKLHFEARHVDATGSLLVVLPKSTSALSVALLNQYVVFDMDNPCNSAPVDPFEKRAASEHWDGNGPAPTQVDFLLMDQQGDLPNAGLIADILPRADKIATRFGWTEVLPLSPLQDVYNLTIGPLYAPYAYGVLGLIDAEDYGNGWAYLVPRFEIGLKVDKDGDSIKYVQSGEEAPFSPCPFETDLRQVKIGVVHDLAQADAKWTLHTLSTSADWLGLELAPALLRHFIGITPPPFTVSSSPASLLSSSSVSGCHTCLTHNAGGVFSNITAGFDCAVCEDNIPLHIFPADPPVPPPVYTEGYVSALFSQVGVMEPIVWNLIKETYAEGQSTVLSDLLDKIEEYHVFEDWVDTSSSDNLLFHVSLGVGQADLAVAVGDGLLTDLALTDVKAIRTGAPPCEMFRIRFDLSAKVYDLYDFDFWAYFPAPYAAVVQVWESATEPIGAIFEVEYEVKGRVELEWDCTETEMDSETKPYKCSFSRYAKDTWSCE